MKYTNTMLYLSRGATKIKLKTIANSPKILFTLGTVMVGTGVVSLIKETFFVKEVVDATNEAIEELNELEKEIENSESDLNFDDLEFKDVNEMKYPIEADKKELYLETGLTIIKSYAPGVLLLLAGIGCFTGSNMILEHRHRDALTTIGLLWSSHTAYRERVKEAVGVEAEHDIYYNLETKEVITNTFDENGNPVQVVEKVKVSKDGTHIKTPTEIIFDESSPYFSTDAYLNKEFLIRVEQAMNSLLKVRGIVFLNEVYKALGVNCVESGQYLGWALDRNLTGGDGEIKFILIGDGGIDFVNNWERSVWIDFNVDPVPVSKYLWTLGPDYNGPSEKDLITNSNI